MKPVKAARQFAAEASLEDVRRAGFSEQAIAALEAATRGAAERRAAWEAAGRPGEAKMLERLQRQNDLTCAGYPGYARNEALGVFKRQYPAPEK